MSLFFRPIVVLKYHISDNTYTVFKLSKPHLVSYEKISPEFGRLCYSSVMTTQSRTYPVASYYSLFRE